MKRGCLPGRYAMDDKRKRKLGRIEELLDYFFKDLSLLDMAMRHRSFVNEQKQSGLTDNERMEFLGDAVIQLAVTEILYDRFTDADEGKLSKFRSFLVTEQSLARVARSFELGTFIHLGRGEEQSGGRDKDSILANTCEALMGAVFIDGGYGNIQQVTRAIFSPLLENLEDNDFSNDFKSRLQELCHEQFHMLPVYQVINSSGPDHDRTFEVEVEINGDLAARGSGKSKKEAEQQAARKALEAMAAFPAARKP